MPRRKYGEEGITEEVRERIDFELGVISGMGFPGYFLIVQSFIAAPVIWASSWALGVDRPQDLP